MPSCNVHLRRPLALALTLTLAAVACSSLWHHDHEQALPQRKSSDSLCATLLPEDHRSDNCPICLSHRLLTQSLVQAVGQSVELVLVGQDFAPAVLLPLGGLSDSSDARAPPCC